MPYDSEIIVIGCGNVLFKDDGFGPVVINILQKYAKDEKNNKENLINDYKIDPSLELTYSYKNLIEELAGFKNKNI